MCERMGEAKTVQLHTPYPHPAYSTIPVLPDPIIQSPKENMILHNPPPLLNPPPPSVRERQRRRGGGQLQQWRRRLIQEEAMEEEKSPPESVDPAGYVAVHGEDGSKEAQKGEGGGG